MASSVYAVLLFIAMMESIVLSNILNTLLTCYLLTIFPFPSLTEMIIFQSKRVSMLRRID